MFRLYRGVPFYIFGKMLMQEQKQYIVFQPNLPGEIMLRISGDGKILYCRCPAKLHAYENMLRQIKRGVANDKANNLVAVSTTGKLKDCLTLKQLQGKQKRTGSVRNLSTISPQHRYKGRDWANPLLVEQVKEMHDQGLSIREIAKNIGVNPSTLTRANRRHHLYPERELPMGLSADQGNGQIQLSTR